MPRINYNNNNSATTTEQPERRRAGGAVGRRVGRCLRGRAAGDARRRRDASDKAARDEAPCARWPRPPPARLARRRAHARAPLSCAEEFVAHGGAVNCVQVGRKTGSVMVTGGSDNRVNVWAVGKPNAIMVRARVRRASAPPAAARRGVWRGAQSLSGHTSAVECVSFDSAEQTVIAGSSGGTLKMWDLEHGKVARTLTGHRCNCVSVQARAGRAPPRREPRSAPLPPHCAVASIRRVLRLRLRRHQPQDLGHSQEVVHTDVPRPHQGRAAGAAQSPFAP